MIGRRGFIFRGLGLVAAALMPWRAPAAEPETKELMGNPAERFANLKRDGVHWEDEWRRIAAESNLIVDDAPLVYNQELYGPSIYEVPEGHTAVVRTSLPRAKWRKLNEPLTWDELESIREHGEGLRLQMERQMLEDARLPARFRIS